MPSVTTVGVGARRPKREDLRPVIAMDRFVLRPDVDADRFSELKRLFKKTIVNPPEMVSMSPWGLLASGSQGPAGSPSFNFWRLKNSNEIRLGMESLQEFPFFHEMIDCLATEQQGLLAPLPYCPPLPSAEQAARRAPDLYPDGYRYVLETFRPNGSVFRNGAKLIRLGYWLKQCLQSQFHWHLVLAGVRVTGQPGAFVHLWAVPPDPQNTPQLQLDPIRHQLGSFRRKHQPEPGKAARHTEQRYRDLVDCMAERELVLLKPTPWDFDEPAQAAAQNSKGR